MASADKGDADDLRIVLLGVCEAGKSSAGNAILGREAFKESRTRESELQSGRVEDRNISIIDTPGFFNTQLTDEEMKKQMMKSLDLSDPGPHVFLLIINLETFRDDERNVVEQIQEIFGAHALRFTMVLVTGGEKMSKREWLDFQLSQKFRDLLDHCMNNYHVINSKTVRDPTNVTKLLAKIDQIKQNYNEIYFKNQIKSEKENKKTEEENDRKIQQATLVQDINNMQILKEKSTTNGVSEKKAFISHETKNEIVKQSVKSLRNAFEKTGEENTVQTPEKCLKIESETGQWHQKKQLTAKEQQSNPTAVCASVSESIKHSKPREHTDLRIVMVGKTGAGKSATGNTILGRKAFKEEQCENSVTKICQQHQQTVEGRNISVIDTPGLCDTSISEDQLKEEIVQCVEMSVPGPHVFLLVIRVDVRLTDEEKNTVKWIQENFGEEAACYTILLFTRGDQLQTPEEEFMAKNKQIKELVKQCKGGYHVFNNKDKGHRSQVTELLEKIERMVMENGGEHYTNEIYKEAQRKIEEEEKRKREEEERRKFEEEEKIRGDERSRMLNKAKGVALVGTGVVVCAGAAVAGGAISPALVSGAVVAGGAALASAVTGGTLSEVITAGAGPALALLLP